MDAAVAAVFSQHFLIERGAKFRTEGFSLWTTCFCFTTGFGKSTAAHRGAVMMRLLTPLTIISSDRGHIKWGRETKLKGCGKHSLWYKTANHLLPRSMDTYGAASLGCG